MIARGLRLLAATFSLTAVGLVIASPAGASGLATTTALAAVPSGPSVSGQPVTFTATVTPVSGPGTPTGNVDFTFTSPVSCTGGDTQSMTGGVASCTVDGLVAADSPITVTATYLGDSSFVSSNTTLNQTITLGATDVSVTPSITLPSIGSGKPINFTAAIAAVAPATGTPTGVVSWTVVGFNGTVVYCSNGLAVRVSRLDTAKCQIPSGQLVAADAPWTITALYSGDANFSENSGDVTQAVHSTTTTTHISSSPNPPSVSEPLNITASVTVPRFAVAPTGTITFAFSILSGATWSPLSVTCNGGSNTLDLTTTFATCTLPAGVEPHGTKYRVQATYSGDPNNGGSTSNFRGLPVH